METASKKKLIRPISVVYIGQYRFRIVFNNLEVRIYEMDDYSKSLFMDQRHMISEFKLNSIKALEFKNGYDICPDILYSESIPIS